MANENEVVVTTKVETDEARSGLEDLFAQLDQMKEEVEQMNQPTAVEPSFFSTIEGGISSAMDHIMEQTNFYEVALQAIVGLWNEIGTAVESAAAAYDKSIDAINKFYDAKEKAAKKGNAKDQLGNGGLPADVEEAIKELGAIQRGFAASGTWTRTFQDFGQRATDFFSGDDEDEARLREGKKIAERERAIDKNNEKEQERREFQAKADENRWRQQTRQAEEYAKEQHRLDEQERREREQFDNERWKNQNKEAGEYFKNSEKLSQEEAKKEEMQQRFADRERMAELSKPQRPDRDFKSHTEGLEETYRRLANAAAGSKEDPAQKAYEQRIQIWEEQKKLRKEEEQRALEKQDKIITTLESKLGLA